MQRDEDFTSAKKICLTFDDGPTSVTEAVLDFLAKRGIKATFFVIGRNVERNPNILRRIFREGHTVGLHTYSHEYKCIYASAESLREDIEKCAAAVKRVWPSFAPLFYRFPGGSFGLREELKGVPGTLGLTAVDWNAACRDSEVDAELPAELAGYAVATARGKHNVIMLLHDAADKKMTALALPEIVERFESDGFYFATIEKVVKIS